MNEQETEGDTLEFAKFLFDQNNPPIGPIVYYDDSFRDINVYFKALCEVFVYGVKLFNDVDPMEPLPYMLDMKPNTLEFLSERFSNHLEVIPILSPCKGWINGPGPHIWELAHTLDQCRYYNTSRQICLQFNHKIANSACHQPRTPC